MKYTEDMVVEILTLDEEVLTPGQMETIAYVEANDNAMFGRAKAKANIEKAKPKPVMTPPKGGTPPEERVQIAKPLPDPAKKAYEV